MRSPGRLVAGLSTVAVAALVAVPGLGPAAQAAGSLKPVLAGVVDRKSPPPSAYVGAVHAYVVQATWANLQAAPGAEITDFAPGDDTAGNVIDTAIGYVRSHPSQGLRLKLRVYAGDDAPDWAKNLPVTSGQPGPFQICDPTTGVCGTMGHFWEANYRQAYADFQAKLAAKYDAEPEIAEVAITGCSTMTGEPLLRQAAYTANLSAYATAGYNEAANEACERDQVDAHGAWSTTRSSFAYNPYQRWDAANSKFTTDETFTETMVDYCRSTLGGACVIGNNGLGKYQLIYSCSDIGASDWTTRNVNARLYTVLTCKGAPLYFQTASASKIASSGTTLSAALDRGVALGAEMVELPTGYSDPNQPAVYLTPDQLACYDSQLKGTGGCPAPDSPPTAPTNLTASVSGSSVQLSWTASTDDKGVASYSVRRDGAQVGSTAGTSYADSGVPAGSHSYTVVATDTAGQTSPASNIATVTIGDTVAPSAPSGLTARQVSTSRVDLAWTAATDNVGVVRYQVLRNSSVTGSSTTTAYSDTSVRKGPSYTYTVKAVDAAGNVGPASNAVSIKVR